MLLIAGALQTYSMLDNYRAEQHANLLLRQVRVSSPSAEASAAQADETIPLESDNIGDEPVGDDLDDTADDPRIPDAVLFAYDAEEEEPPPVSTEDSVETAVPTAPPIRYDVAGVLSIPQLRLELPVIAECTPSLLKVSVCKYKGDAEGKPTRLVIAGHNYSSHFGRIPKLEPGDTVSFTNNDGVTYQYIITEITSISMDDHRGLAKGDWDITLFTCDKDRTRRVLVRCSEL